MPKNYSYFIGPTSESSDSNSIAITQLIDATIQAQCNSVHDAAIMAFENNISDRLIDRAL